MKTSPAVAQSPRRRAGTAGLAKRIEREAAEHRRRWGSIPFPFLNNFHGRLPGGFYRDIFDAEALHRPFRDSRASRKLRAMTPAQFFELIDRRIAELGLDVAVIQELLESRSSEIYDYVYPLYFRLREDGFKHYPDLTV